LIGSPKSEYAAFTWIEETAMNVSMNTSAALAQNTSDIVGMTVLKKAINIEAQSVIALIESIPQPQQSSANLPPNLGQNINITA
jgi:hypothetical protein